MYEHLEEPPVHFLEGKIVVNNNKVRCGIADLRQ